jgi:2,5-dihydroxypyridine 5,6-dioxygenase
MTVSSAASNLSLDMAGASTVGVWGWTASRARWRTGGRHRRRFCTSGAVNVPGARPGDINLAFSAIAGAVAADAGGGLRQAHRGERGGAEMVRSYLAAWGDRGLMPSAGGFGLNRKALRALAVAADTNGTELRAVAGNFCSPPAPTSLPGATCRPLRHPVIRSTIAIGGTEAVRGVLQDVSPDRLRPPSSFSTAAMPGSGRRSG